MKRSKIFFGAAALVLAAVSAFAATSAHRSNTYFYRLSPTDPCSQVIVDFNCTPATQGGCIGVSGPSAGQQLFNDNLCTVKLKKI